MRNVLTSDPNSPASRNLTLGYNHIDVQMTFIDSPNPVRNTFIDILYSITYKNLHYPKDNGDLDGLIQKVTDKIIKKTF
jgi:hypothetical protein